MSNSDRPGPKGVQTQERPATNFLLLAAFAFSVLMNAAGLSSLARGIVEWTGYIQEVLRQYELLRDAIAAVLQLSGVPVVFKDALIVAGLTLVAGRVQHRLLTYQGPRRQKSGSDEDARVPLTKPTNFNTVSAKFGRLKRINFFLIIALLWCVFFIWFALYSQLTGIPWSEPLVEAPSTQSPTRPNDIADIFLRVVFFAIYAVVIASSLWTARDVSQSRNQFIVSAAAVVSPLLLFLVFAYVNWQLRTIGLT